MVGSIELSHRANADDPKVKCAAPVGTLVSMQLDQIVAEALKLHPRSRARLAETLLESLDELTAEQNEEIWAEEADRRDSEPDATDRPADEVFKELRGQLT